MKLRRTIIFLILLISSSILFLTSCPKPPKPPVIDHGKERVEKVIDIKKPKKIKDETVEIYVSELRYHLIVETGQKSRINIFTDSFPKINLVNQYWEIPERDLAGLEKELEKKRFTRDDFLKNPGSYSAFLKKEENIKDVFLLGCYYFKTLDDETGRKIFLTLASQLEKEKEYIILIAELFFSRKLYDDALQTYDYLLYQSPAYAELIFKRKLDILSLQDDRQGIQTVFENIIQYDKTNINSYMEFTDYLILQKDYPAAEKVIKQAYKEFDRGQVISKEAQLLHIQGRTEEAIKLLKDYLRKDPFNYGAVSRYIELMQTKDDFYAYQDELYKRWQRGEDLKDFELLEYAYFQNNTTMFIKYVDKLNDKEKWVKLTDYLFSKKDFYNCAKAINTAILKDSSLKKNKDLEIKKLICLLQSSNLKPSPAAPYGLLQIADRPGGISGFFSVVYERQDFFMKYDNLLYATNRINERNLIYNRLEDNLSNIKEISLQNNTANILISHYLNSNQDNKALELCRKFFKKSEEDSDRKYYLTKFLEIKRKNNQTDDEYIDYLKTAIVEFNDQNAKYYLETLYKSRQQYDSIIELYSELYRYNQHSDEAFFNLINAYLSLSQNKNIIDNCKYYVKAYELVEAKIIEEKRYDFLEYFYNLHFYYTCSKKYISEDFLNKYWWNSKMLETKYF
ncbi:MAG: tetratricopeptide repeat protein, partial [bacterium]|nr:tetratricopeptide repeat protein [bacterium]